MRAYDPPEITLIREEILPLPIILKCYCKENFRSNITARFIHWIILFDSAVAKLFRLPKTSTLYRTLALLGCMREPAKAFN